MFINFCYSCWWQSDFAIGDGDGAVAIGDGDGDDDGDGDGDGDGGVSGREEGWPSGEWL